MDVALTPEQEQWQEALDRLADAHAVTNPAAIPTDDAWGQVVGLGLPALRSPALSGVEAAGVECAIAVEQLARRLCVVPAAGQGVIAPELLEAAGATDQLQAIAEGDLRIAPTLTVGLDDLGHSGAPAVAFDAVGADHALVLDGSSLVMLTLGDAQGVGLDLTRTLRAVDGGSIGQTIGTVDADRLERVRAVALTALAADLLGVMEAAVDDAVQHAKDREQFGTPIGSFQAVQHLLADAAVAVEGARSCVWHAAWAIDHLETDAALLAARAAKACCSDAGRSVVEATVQVFGGIAITWEHVSHLRLRRVHLDRQCLGDEQVHYRAIAAARLAAQVSA